ncbi:MAG: hypothetical protein C4536_16195 [Actinobacteria bacterium]|jgi:hypothetical protein|nr:MAG: hypothetical protein C4536_16195 [Actinomycetota bacterium]
MKRLFVLSLLLILLVVVFVGCGGGADATSPSDGESGGGGPVGQAEAATCAANRKTIAAAAQQYYGMEGTYPTSIQQLVPGYLQSVPACPSGGTYTLQGSTVTCSVHGQ